MFSTIVVGAILAGILFIAIRRVVHDMKQKGCSSCSGCSFKDKCSEKK